MHAAMRSAERVSRWAAVRGAIEARPIAPEAAAVVALSSQGAASSDRGE
jgi:hypothetical protein